MNLLNILILSILAFLTGWLVPNKLRAQVIFAASVLAIFWLQPATAVRNLDFWLSISAIFLTILVWSITQPRSNFFSPEITKLFLLSAALVSVVAGLRFFDGVCCLTASTPPPFLPVLISLVISLVILLIFHYLPSSSSKKATILTFVILILFIILKTPALATQASSALRRLTGQDISLASSMDLSWLGFSYLAFRLLHTLRDFQAGKLAPVGLAEFASYALFFPSYTAGPIDRIQHFSAEIAAKQEISQPVHGWQKLMYQPVGQNSLNGAVRIIWGIFKKFVLADSLALISLNPSSAHQVASPFWTWVLLYAFSLRIYFDFSGYTDIAIGLGKLLGIKLPENFDQPYKKQNLTSFWNSWHITLSLWFRAYFFNPLTRYLRTNWKNVPVWLVIMLGQLATMLLIGLWHGVSWNFALWGAWHGFGLFFHNRWADWVRSRPQVQRQSPTSLALGQFLGWFVTFHYVTLGWIWFVLAEPASALLIFQRLFSFLPGI